MNTRILKEISKKVQSRETVLEDGKIEYSVERKNQHGEWEVIARSLRKERVLAKKHNAWAAQLHFMHLTNKLLNRRKFGKQKFLGININ